jgi:hypothetical protein
LIRSRQKPSVGGVVEWLFAFACCGVLIAAYYLVDSRAEFGALELGVLAAYVVVSRLVRRRVARPS